MDGGVATARRRGDARDRHRAAARSRVRRGAGSSGGQGSSDDDYDDDDDYDNDDDDGDGAHGPEGLRRAIENVVRNAVRFTREGTAVEVRVASADDAVEITARDHGPGVPEEALEAIFEPLFRVDPDRDRKTGGTGLGLAIAERAFAAHRGEVKAANAEGGGLLVTMRLPRERH